MNEAGSIKHFLEELTNMDSKQIEALPFPAALFTRTGILVSVSMSLAHYAGIGPADLSEGRISFLDRITTENSEAVDAAERVFAGETGVVNDLVAPISMFVRDDDVPDYQGGYQTALFFPVRSEGGTISCGGVVLLKQRVVIQEQEE